MSINKGGKGNESKKKRGVLKSQSREMIVNVRTYFEAEKVNGGPLIPVDQVKARTAAACHISESYMANILNEKRTKIAEDAKASSTGKKRTRDEVDSCQEVAIRRHIYAYYEREEYPTMRRLVASLSQAGLFPGSTTTLCYVLKDLGFSWKKIRGNRKLLMESVYLTAWRGRFIRDVLAVPLERIIWIGETCVNSDHFKRRRDDESETKNSSKGFRIIIVHAGSSEGFVNNAKLVFRGKKNSSDYRNDISQPTFKQWFTEQLIPNINPNSIIVMDDAPYHCVPKEKYPTIAQSKDEIIAWLESKNIKFDPMMFKIELLELVKREKPRWPVYEIDEIAKVHGHRVLRIPPNHSNFNPIEIIWAKIKSYVAERSLKFKALEATKLTEEKIKNIHPQDWEIAIKNTMEVIRDQVQLDEIVEDKMDRMMHAPSNNSETEESECSDDEFSDAEEMEVEDFPPPERRPSEVFQELQKTASPRGISSFDERRNTNLEKSCKQKLVNNRETEFKTKEDREKETSILFRRLSDSLHTKQKTFPASVYVEKQSDGSMDIEKPCKQECDDWNGYLEVKKEEES